MSRSPPLLLLRALAVLGVEVNLLLRVRRAVLLAVVLIVLVVKVAKVELLAGVVRVVTEERRQVRSVPEGEGRGSAADCAQHAPRGARERQGGD